MKLSELEAKAKAAITQEHAQEKVCRIAMRPRTLLALIACIRELRAEYEGEIVTDENGARIRPRQTCAQILASHGLEVE